MTTDPISATAQHCASSATPEPTEESAARARVSGIIDLAELKACVMTMASNHGQWRSRIARLAFAAAKERIAAQRERLRSFGYESAWLDRVASANFKHPRRDGFSTDVESLFRDVAPSANHRCH